MFKTNKKAYTEWEKRFKYQCEYCKELFHYKASMLHHKCKELNNHMYETILKRKAKGTEDVYE